MVVEIDGLIQRGLIRAKISDFAVGVWIRIAPSLMSKNTSIQKHYQSMVLNFPKMGVVLKILSFL